VESGVLVEEANSQLCLLRAHKLMDDPYKATYFSSKILNFFTAFGLALLNHIPIVICISVTASHL